MSKVLMSIPLVLIILWGIYILLFSDLGFRYFKRTYKNNSENRKYPSLVEYFSSSFSSHK